METILKTILKEKQKEVFRLKESFSKETLKRTVPVRSFYNRCKEAKDMQVIAEFKRSSPSKGEINHSIEPGKQAKIYAEAGASMISVLTDKPFFQGEMADLVAVREAVSLPILNKDFIIDPVQIDRAYVYGADVILLIVAALSDEQLKNLNEYAEGLGLEVLVEVHNEEELQRAQVIQPKLIGINNRNLKTFEVTLETTERLAEKVDTAEQVLISESGMSSVEEVKRAWHAGARAILVGETLMKAKNVKETIHSFQQGADNDAC
ncbi:indole-3-glycerol phosphate synthase TrpC [Alkalibacterium sp. 20]|uniref:indole-3-glycerol phosphate synthase TrpC n=1 Tax=Alkalibacterium sp. 20 TaxID=1798803 RepID=UPI00090002AF|nr:indole-3-glycerol phosphate synthase TrpC [Alkalibacterium sp. 20]OJF94606.1 indole-3-glycerol phosphate synthase [Alkalibacterium sp. 20]